MTDLIVSDPLSIAFSVIIGILIVLVFVRTIIVHRMLKEARKELWRGHERENGSPFRSASAALDEVDAAIGYVDGQKIGGPDSRGPLGID
jgi:hypothetical protein